MKTMKSKKSKIKNLRVLLTGAITKDKKNLEKSLQGAAHRDKN